MKPVKLAVVGTGHLGRIHARLAAQQPDAELVAVVDPDETACTTTAEQCGAEPLSGIEALAGKVDAAIVATPTSTHHAVGMQLLDQGLHVLMEKPMAADLSEAQELDAKAQACEKILQVGHVERFNPALGRVLDELDDPKYIDAVRVSGYPFRSTDVGVVLDLMIHDLDVVLALTKSPVVAVQALGLSVLGKHEDVVNARLTFESGCVANLTASRVSYQANRSMQVWTPELFAAVDFGMRTTTVLTPSDLVRQRQLDVDALSPEEANHLRNHFFEEVLVQETVEGAEGNALADEQLDFLTAIRQGAAPRVTGQQGCDVLAVAERILESVETHRWDGGADGRVGPLAGLMPSPILRGPHWNLAREHARGHREAG